MKKSASKWSTRLLIALVLLLGVGGAAAYMLGMIPGFPQEKPGETAHKEPERSKVHLVKDIPQTLFVPDDVRTSLGIRKNGEDVVAIAKPPKYRRPLVLSASTLFDPNKLQRVKVRFAPADVIRISPNGSEPGNGTSQGAVLPELRTGDYVVKDQPLAVFYSTEVGFKKNELIDALINYKTHKKLLDKAESSFAFPPALLLTYEQSVSADLNAVNRALKTLETWKIPTADIQAVYDEADTTFKNNAKRDFDPKNYNPDKSEDKWGRVVLKAPESGFIVERNVSEKELVVDSNIVLFQIIGADKLLVMANAPEEAVKEIYEEWMRARKKKESLEWTIRTLGEPDGKGITGTIDEIGMIVDPNQKTVPIKGYIPNQDRVLRAGQYVTATIELPAPKDLVEIPADAVADDGKQAIVFVQRAGKKDEYVMRRVVIANRFLNRVFVRSSLEENEKELTREDKAQGLLAKEELHPDERVILAGLLNLKKELEDLQSQKNE